MYLEIILLVIFLLLFLYKYFEIKIPDEFPPGPKAYPFVGSMLAMTSSKYKSNLMSQTIKKMTNDFGPIFGLASNQFKIVAVNGYEAVKEVLTNEDFSGRPVFPFTVDKNYNPDYLHKNLGLIFSYGDVWTDARRFTIRQLRDLGIGKTSQEQLVHDEIEDCFKEIEKMISTTPEIQMNDIFTLSIVNIFWGLISGKRFPRNDPVFHEMIDKLAISFRYGNTVGIKPIFIFPFLRHWPHFSAQWKDLMGGRVSILNYAEQKIREHRAAKKGEGEANDFIDQYLEEIDKNSEIKSNFTDLQLSNICVDLFIAGSDTTANSLNFALLYMILYPEVQKKVQDEIQDVIGSHRLPSYSDRTKLPYTEAVLNELLRLTPAVPMTLPHGAVKDTNLFQYKIPKDTMIMINLESVNKDPEYWKDAEFFKPERFLDSDGNFVKNERLFAFGLGKRACIGETFARINYFLFFTSFMQKFSLQCIPNEEKPSAEPLNGVIVCPKPYKAKVTLR